jgi:hypothetical protein
VAELVTQAGSAPTMAMPDVANMMSALKRMSDGVIQAVPAPTDMTSVMSAIKRVGDNVTQAVKQVAAMRPSATSTAAPEPAPQATPPAPEPAAEAPAESEPEAVPEAPAADDDAPAAADEADLEAAGSEPDEPEPEAAPAAAPPRTTLSYIADPGPEGPNLPPSIHRAAADPEAEPPKREEKPHLAPDTSQQGYAVTVKPVVAKALGTYLPKALQKISDTLGGKTG